MNDVHIRALRRLDLNLLPVLDALLQTGSVTQAAARLHLSQSAVSHALARLREALGDALFVRGAGGLQPTAWCQELRPTLRRLLGELAGALSPPEAFSPRGARRTFSIGMSDYAALLLLPPLLEQVRAQAPGVQIEARQVEQPEGLALERGALDLAVLLRVEERPGLLQRPLFRDRFQCMVRADHPAVGRRLTLERYLELSHLLISPQGHGPGFVDAALAGRGLTRHIALRVPYFVAAPLIIARTDLVLTLPERVARALVGGFPLRLLPPPLELGGFTMHLVWHERCQHDGGHRWLRELIGQVIDQGAGAASSASASEAGRPSPARCEGNSSAGSRSRS